MRKGNENERAAEGIPWAVNHDWRSPDPVDPGSRQRICEQGIRVWPVASAMDVENVLRTAEGTERARQVRVWLDYGAVSQSAVDA